MDAFEDARLPRPLQFLAWTFPVGRVFGVPVRMHATAAFVLLFALSEFAAWHARWSVTLAYAALSTVLLYAVVLAHELGHVLTARRWWGVPCDRITLSVLGGLAHLSHPAPSPKAEVAISLAGPATHVLWLAALWPLRSTVVSGLATPPGWPIHPIGFAADALWYLNLSLAGFNLLPFYPLDGGRVLRALLAMRWNANRASRVAAQVGLAGAAGLAVYALAQGGVAGGVGVAIAVAMALRCRDEIVIARHSEGPYGPRREAWEGDPDAWKAGRGAFDDVAEPTVAPRALPRRQGRARRLATTEAPEALPAELALPASPRPAGRSPAEEAELDRLLDRVHDVGLSGLTAEERARLERLSRAH